MARRVVLMASHIISPMCVGPAKVLASQINKQNRRRRGPSKQRYKSEKQSVSYLIGGTEDVFVGALYVNMDTVSEEKTSWCKNYQSTILK